MWADEQHNNPNGSPQQAQPPTTPQPAATQLPQPVVLDIDGGQGSAPGSKTVSAPSSDRNMCIICEENERDVRLPCGHALLCETCTKKLLKIQQPCPTCRAPFSRYYKSTPNQINDQPSFLNPMLELAQFGRLQRMSFPELLAKTWRKVTNSGKACSQLFCLLTLGLLLVIVLSLNLALGIAEVVLGVQGLDKHCDKPLAKWLIVLGIAHLGSWMLSLRASRSQDPEHRAKVQRWKTLQQISLLVLIVLGFSYVVDSKDCNHTLYSYAYIITTIYLCVTGLLLSLFIISVCTFCFCRDNNNSSSSNGNNRNSNGALDHEANVRLAEDIMRAHRELEAIRQRLEQDAAAQIAPEANTAPTQDVAVSSTTTGANEPPV